MADQQIVCRIEKQALDVVLLRQSLPERPDCGGYVSFAGIVRNINHGRRVIRLEYEVYEALATKELQRIAATAVETFKLGFVRCIHRSGPLGIGDPAVVVDVLSRHRAEAFIGCRYIIDQLKRRVPIWKKEYYDDGSHAWTQCHEGEHALDPSH